MEKPAVMFSAEGFKMFTDLIRDLTMAQGAKQLVDNDDLLNKDDADALVKEYFKRPEITGKVEEVESNAKYDMDDVAQTVLDYLYHHPGDEVTSTDIQQMLTLRGFDYSLRAVTPVMTGVINRYPSIERVGQGLYSYVGPVKEDE